MTVTEVFGSMPSGEAYAKAKKMSRYGHHDWLVWKLVDGTFCTAKLTQESLEVALRECKEDTCRGVKRPMIVRVQGDGICHNASAALAAIWLKNLKAGYG